ncbi:DUF453-domain-containing protein [Leucogyrophana mollusca]|uniref:DUF453-domain-containing protein n=1 Tax=Leucogyrophana mollusca TaxID=85980 RepID=A0ACB8BKG5_9AGAM|nr:DUF453-domain-containing protein [Leucogyrophana mollusca]
MLRSVTRVSPSSRIHRVARFSTLNPLPATFLRGGTSKGVFINRAHLPTDPTQWPPIFLGLMGSPDPDHGRQLNGMGGGISSLSKICVVGPPSDEQRAQGIDAEYTFVQVGVRDASIDYSGNCGNLTSMAGVFALDEGICHRTPSPSTSTTSIRLFNTNTKKRIDTSFPVSISDDACVPHLDIPQVSMAGVSGKASRITLDFVFPAGARTGKLLPTGNPTDTITVSILNAQTHIPASLVDATNPGIFVAISDLKRILNVPETSEIDFGDPKSVQIVESIRQEGARLMGLDPTAQAQPKIAFLAPSTDTSTHDIVIHAFSMGVLHKAVPLTVALCLGVAANVQGANVMRQLPANTVAGRDGEGGNSQGMMLRIRHPSGVVEVKSAKVIRTGRRLMKGVVWW